MSGIQALVRLSRPVNLLIMAATMYALRFLIMWPLLRKASLGLELQLSDGLFFLSCLVLLLLGAAGNVINDYFDRKVDMINKPERLIVGKLVKRRIAMILHHTLNILALLLTLIIVWSTGKWSGLLYPVVMATALWWYSPVFKKQPFTGNLLIALMVASIPFWTGYFEIALLREEYSDMMSDPVPFFRSLWLWLAAYAIFAFILTLSREALKDIEDIEGDKKGGYRTLPIIWGVDKTISYIRRLQSAALIIAAISSLWVFKPFREGNLFVFLMCALLVFLPLFITIILCGKTETKEHITRISRWMKISMICGIAFSWFAGQWILQS